MIPVPVAVGKNLNNVVLIKIKNPLGSKIRGKNWRK